MTWRPGPERRKSSEQTGNLVFDPGGGSDGEQQREENWPTENRMTLSRKKCGRDDPRRQLPAGNLDGDDQGAEGEDKKRKAKVMIVCRAVSVPAVDRGQGGIQSADASTAEMTCSAICSRSRATKGTIQSEDRT